MSLSTTTTVGETASSATASTTTTTTTTSSSHHYKESEQVRSGSSGNSGSSTVIGTSTQEPTSTLASFQQQRQQIGQSTTTARIAGANRIRTTRTATIKRRQKVKEFNDVISCYLCRGYLINATTIDYCVHSFCRPCIVKHLEQDKHCPQCRPGGKQISLANLRPDDQLKSLVYKLVPGLYQSEHQRQVQFYNENATSRGEDQDDGGLCDSEEDYFSPVEPISLSLEYHPESLQGCSKQQIPPIRYLQCPAAVTIHHLKRFISSKFDIDPDNERVDIEIIYEDEVLPEDFSLMDVGYCYSWKRVAPMRFFYRILVHSLCNKLNQVVPSDSVQSESDNVIEAKRTKKSNEASAQKTVRFKEINEKETKEKTTSSVASENSIEVSEDETQTAQYSIVRQKPSKGEQSKDLSSGDYNQNENRNKSPGGTNAEKSQVNGGKGPVKMTIIARKPNEVKIKLESSKNKNKSKSSTPAPTSSDSPSSVVSDFKSLRSNDIRYCDYSVSSTASSTSTTSSSALTKGKTSSSKSKSTTGTKDLTQKAVSKCDIVVSIPQSHIHRSSNSSDDSLENLSLAQLKTANKKNSSGSTSNVVNLKQNSGTDAASRSQKGEEKCKQDVPKLKIELPSLRTKITVPKKSPEVVESKKSQKARKRSTEEQSSPAANQVDLTTYAKNIGLKPIKPVVEDKKEDKTKSSSDKSPSSSSPASSPPSTTNSAFIFSADGSSSTSHKKRKKGKHSKEPKEPGSKRRKLHAEIASQPAEESLKLKVKITANHKSHKAEKKLNSSSSVEEVVTPPVVTTVPISSGTDTTQTTTVAKSTPNKSSIESTVSSSNVSKPTQESKQELPKLSNRNKQGVNIPNLNKTLSEESSNINNLIKENSNPKPADQFAANANKPSASASKIKVLSPVSTKGITITSVTVVTSSHTSSSNTVNQSQAKLLPPKILGIQEAKIPISPPLPPSLFKTVPMTLQAATTNSSKPSIPQNQPRYSTPGDIRHMGMSQLKRLANLPNQKTQGNFVVPNPPKSLPNSPKLCPITSIASAANRQAAQLKRSASLDSSPPILPKQQKLDQDRVVRKTTYTPFVTQVPTSTSASVSAGIKIHNSTPPIITNTNSAKVSEQQTFYTSTMGPTYTREILTRKAMPILLPPSSVSVTKMSDVITSKLTHPTSAVTITPQQQQPQQPSYLPLQQKPALEIVRISSNIPPIDQQPITVTNNNTVKPNPPKTTRPPPPPIPLVKIKRSVNQMSILKPTITNVSAPIQQTPVLNNIKSPPIISPPVSPSNNSTPAAKSPDNTVINGQSPVCDNIGALDLSGKSSRSPSQEKNTPTNTPPDTPTQTANKDLPMGSKQVASNLEAALNKLKQQSSAASAISVSQPITAQMNSVLQNSAIPTTSEETSKTTITPVTTAAETNLKPPSSHSQPVQKLSDSTNGLQNLKLLSESATNREKIAIKNQRTLPMLPKLNEITKMRANPTVRQQNASVRNIPNPSALAFRSHQPIPMLASITKTASPQKSTASTSATTSPVTSIAGVPQTTQETILPKPQTTSTTASVGDQLASLVSSTGSSITTIATTDSSKLIGSKKNLHLEQLAATLNMRALSAAADASKLAGTNSSNACTNGSASGDSGSTKTVSTVSISLASQSTTTVTSVCESTTGSTTLPSGTSLSAVSIASTSTPTVVTATTA